MNLTPVPHILPYDASFEGYMEHMREAVAASGAPAYPIFVDRLFKQMPMMSPQAVMDLVVAHTADGHLDVEKLAISLQRAMHNPDGSAMHAAVGCSGEGGELLDCVKKVFIYGKSWTARDPKTGQTPLENVVEELGDFRFYYQKLLNMLGLTDADIQAANMVKLMDRYKSGTYTDAEALGRADKNRPAIADQQPARQFFGQKA